MWDYQNYTDEQLIERLFAGETEIEDYLMEKYKTIVRAKARAMYLIGGDTDDLIQEGMIGLVKAVRNYKKEKQASFRTYANLCIERQMYKAIEASKGKKHQPLNSYISLSEKSSEEILMNQWEDSPESILVDQERAESKMDHIRNILSPFENHVLELHLSGYTYIQIADMMDKVPKSIDNAIQRIRAKVRNMT